MWNTERFENRSKRKRRLLWLLDPNSMKSIVGKSLEGVCGGGDESEEDPSDISGLEGFNSVLRGQPFARQVHFHLSSLLQRR